MYVLQCCWTHSLSKFHMDFENFENLKVIKLSLVSFVMSVLGCQNIPELLENTILFYSNVMRRGFVNAVDQEIGLTSLLCHLKDSRD